MTPEQLRYVREWARSGNDLREDVDLPVGFTVQTMVVVESNAPGPAQWDEMDELSPAGLIIAKLADALEQANETAEEAIDNLDHWAAINLTNDKATMRANRLELLG